MTVISHLEEWLFILFGIVGMSVLSGDSANAVPHYQKLRTRVTHIWGDRSGQPNLSAMEGPHTGGTTSWIMVSSVPGKYA